MPLGPHRLENGILMRRDLHALFDAGYVTVTPSLVLRVSRRIREEFENGCNYYALEGSSVAEPADGPRDQGAAWRSLGAHPREGVALGILRGIGG